jgi:antagonist of KipI
VFPHPAAIVLTGSDFGATLDQLPIALHQTIQIHIGQTLRIGHTRSGARCYLCVNGGIFVRPFLGSASTHTLTGLGGFHGRALRKGDILEIGPATQPFRKRTLAPNTVEVLAARKTLRVTAGPQAKMFPESSHQVFYQSTFGVSEESNRMGLRLAGPFIPAGTSGTMVTEGASLGAIQITPEGEAIILFVDQQTTGGYPKIANVITADLPSIGQLRPRDEIRFEPVDWDTAHQLLLQQKGLLDSAKVIIE